MVERIQWIDSPERRDWHVLLRPSDLMFFAYKAARPYDTTDAGRTNRQPKSVNYIAFKVGNDPDRQIIRRFYRHLGDELQRGRGFPGTRTVIGFATSSRSEILNKPWFNTCTLVLIIMISNLKPHGNSIKESR